MTELILGIRQIDPRCAYQDYFYYVSDPMPHQSPILAAQDSFLQNLQDKLPFCDSH